MFQVTGIHGIVLLEVPYIPYVLVIDSS